MSSRSVLIIVLWLIAGMFVGGMRGAAAADPAAFVRALGDQAVAALGNTMAVRQAQFRELFRQDFDIARCARLALGRYWRNAGPEQRQEFVKLYEGYIIAAYSYRFSSLKGETFNVLGSRATSEGFAVKSQLKGVNDTTPVTVDWLLVPSGDGFRVIDVVVEGISMVITQRAEFASVIVRNGGQFEPLLALMREKNASNLVSR